MPAESRHHEENALAYQAVYESQGAQSDTKLTPQLLAGAAAYRTFTQYELKRKEIDGEPDDANFHEFAVNTAAEEVDKVIMIKELAGWDAAHITSQAVEQAEAMYKATHRPDQYKAPPEDWGYGLMKRHQLEQAHDALHNGHEHHHHHHGVVKDDGVPELDPESSVAKARTIEIKTYHPHSPAPFGTLTGTYGGFDGPPGGHGF